MTPGNGKEIELVTTFSPGGYRVYGERFIKTWVEHGREDINLVVYHESQKTEDFYERVTWRNLDQNLDRKKFLEDWGNDEDKAGGLFNAVRFSHKIFAIADAIERSSAEWVIWVDGDVEWHGMPSDDQLDWILTGFDLSFLGRDDYGYSECGFVAYRKDSPRVRAMVDDMLDLYSSGRLFSSHPKSDWHDSRVFDICREVSMIPIHRQHNLSDGIEGDHVWPKTVLSEFSVHHKGIHRKVWRSRETWGV